MSSRGISLYASSKAFGEMFFETIGKEYGSLGVNSSSIRMGYFDGRMTTELDEKKLKGIRLNSGNRRLGQAKDLINAINYILENNYTNGGVLDLTGGINHNSKDFQKFPIFKYNFETNHVVFEPINPSSLSDAQLILDLRSRESNNFLRKSSGDINSQIQYLKTYHKRNKLNYEIYYKLKDKTERI